MFNGCSSLKISSIQSSEYPTAWRIPSSGTILSTASSWNTNMLAYTGGTFKENPSINTTYYGAWISIITYNITYDLTNCTGISTNPTTINEGDTATLSFTSNEGYSFPETITVTGVESYTWDKNTGTLILTNATENVNITINCIVVVYPKINSFKYHGKQIRNISGKPIRYVHDKRPGMDNTYEMVYMLQLAAPQNVTTDGTTVSWDVVENATSYEILVDGSGFSTVSTTSVDLSMLSGWSSLTDDNYSVTIVAKTDGYRDSEPSATAIIKEYSITATVTNGTYSGDTTITNNATIIITANSGYKLPDAVTVTGASYTWDKQTGTLVLSNPTGAITVSATCAEDVKETWYLNNSLTLPSGDKDGFTDFYIKFISNNTNFVKIQTWNKVYGKFHMNNVCYQDDNDNNTAGDVTVYAADEGWCSGSVYRTITLLETPTGDLLTWLQANATKQSTSTPALISFTIASKSYKAEEGMTWEDWMNSSYNTDGYFIVDSYVAPDTTHRVSTSNATSSRGFVKNVNAIADGSTYYKIEISG